MNWMGKICPHYIPKHYCLTLFLSYYFFSKLILGFSFSKKILQNLWWLYELKGQIFSPNYIFLKMLFWGSPFQNLPPNFTLISWIQWVKSLLIVILVFSDLDLYDFTVIWNHINILSFPFIFNIFPNLMP